MNDDEARRRFAKILKHIEALEEGGYYVYASADHATPGYGLHVSAEDTDYIGVRFVPRNVTTDPGWVMFG